MMYTNEVFYSNENNNIQTISPVFQSNLSYPPPNSSPYLTIKNKLPEQYRFRYLSDHGSHGGIEAQIELNDCDSTSNIYVKASLYTNEDVPRLHANCFYGNNCDNGNCWVQLSEDSTAKFPALRILIQTASDTEKILKDRIREKYRQESKSLTEGDLKKEVKSELNGWDRNSVKICFEAFYFKDESQPVCDKIFSEPIKDLNKADGKLNISRISSCTGKISGNEEVILLCDKIKGDIKDIEIVFFSIDSDQNEDWKENATFNLTDVHYRVAIPFRTPAFNENIKKDVFIQLRRKDGMISNSIPFHYVPCHELEPEMIAHQAKKRKRLSAPEDGLSNLLDFNNFTGIDEDDINKQPPDALSLEEFISIVNPDNDEEDINQQPSDALSLELKEILSQNLFLEMPDVLSPEGLIDNMATLSIDEKTSAVNKSCSSKTEQKKMQKNSIINFIKDNKIDSCIRSISTLMSFKDEDENNFFHLFAFEEGKNLSFLQKMLEIDRIDLINQVNKIQMTPLLIAISKNQWKIVRILMQFGADPNIRDRNGNNCLHLAAMFDFPFCMKEVLSYLLITQKYSADIQGLNYDGLAPLHLSVLSNSELCTQLLLKANTFVNISDGKCGKTALHFAYQTSPELVELLLNQPEINPYAKDYNGNVPAAYQTKTDRNSSSTIQELNRNDSKLSSRSESSEEDITGYREESDRIHSGRVHDAENTQINTSEVVFCEELNSNGLWKKFALYLMDFEEVSIIEAVDANPTNTLLNQLKKSYGDKYKEKLRYILEDSELKHYAKLLDL